MRPRITVTTTENLKEQVRTTNFTGPTMFSPVFSDKGPDDKIVLVNSVGEFLRMYGNPNFTAYGQSQYNVLRFLATGGSAYVLRLSPEDAAYSHVGLDIQIKSETDKLVNTSDGIQISIPDYSARLVDFVSGNNESDITLEQSFITPVAPNGSSFTGNPLLIFRALGKGGKTNISIRIEDNPSLGTINEKLYYVSILEDGTIVEGPYNVSLYENSPAYIGDIINENSSFVKVLVDDDMIKHVGSLLHPNPKANTNDPLWPAFDILFCAPVRVNNVEVQTSVEGGEENGNIPMSSFVYNNSMANFVNPNSTEGKLTITDLAAASVRSSNETRVYKEAYQRAKDFYYTSVAQDTAFDAVEFLTDYTEWRGDGTTDGLSLNRMNDFDALNTAIVAEGTVDYATINANSVIYDTLNSMLVSLPRIFSDVMEWNKQRGWVFESADWVAGYDGSGIAEQIIEFVGDYAEISKHKALRKYFSSVLSSAFGMIKKVKTTSERVLYANEYITTLGSLVTDFVSNTSPTLADYKLDPTTIAGYQSIIDRIEAISGGSISNYKTQIAALWDSLITSIIADNVLHVAYIADTYMLLINDNMANITTAGNAFPLVLADLDTTTTLMASFVTQASQLTPDLGGSKTLAQLEALYLDNRKNEASYSLHNLDSVTGGGLDGTLETEEKSELLVKAFNGLINGAESVLNVRDYDFDYIFDAQYDVDVKAAMVNLATEFRPNTFVALDTLAGGSGDGSILTALNMRNAELAFASPRVGIWAQYAKIYDGYTGRNIRVSPTYFLASKWNTFGKHLPIAGTSRGLLDNIVELSENITDALYDQLHNAKINYILRDRVVRFDSQFTTNPKDSAISRVNNSLVTNEIRRNIIAVSNNYLFEYNNPTVLNQLRGDIATLLESYVPMGVVTDYVLNVFANSLEEVKVQIEVLFAGVIEWITIDITV